MSGVSIWVIALIAWAITTYVLRNLRRWLLFYLVGAFGFVIIVALGAATFDVDTAVEGVEAAQVASIANAMGVDVSAVGPSGLAVPTGDGWAVFEITLECSAILEIAALVALVCFYPAFRPLERAIRALIGLAITYIVNLMRIVLIVSIIHWQGTSWVFASHAVFGRLFFLAATIALYWFLITRPTVHVTRRRIEEAVSS